MPSSHRSGLLGFLLLLAALVPSAAQAKAPGATVDKASASGILSPAETAAPSPMEARLRRIAAAVREKQGLDPSEPGGQAGVAPGDKLAWVWGNGGGGAWRNGGGWRNGGWGNGFRNGGWGNGGWGNGFRNGGGVVVRW